MYKIILLLFVNFIFMQNINHDSVQTAENGQSIEIDVFADLQGQQIISFDLFYKNSNQTGYFRQSFTSDDDLYYSAIVPADFVGSSDIYYYILLETTSNIVSIPKINPELNPLRVNVIQNRIILFLSPGET